MTTPNINNLVALPFKKRPVTNREQFRGIWSEKKAYVGRVGGKGASFQENKAERRSMEWPWPVSAPIQSNPEGISIFFLKYSMQLSLFFMNFISIFFKCMESLAVNIYGSNTPESKEYLSHIHL